MSQPANLSEELDQLTIFFIIESVANYSNKKNMKLPAEVPDVLHDVKNQLYKYCCVALL